MPDLWPLFGLRLTTPRLELRYADDRLLLELADLARGDIAPPGNYPFLSDWADAPGDERARGTLKWHWRNRADLSRDLWWLTFVVLVDGRVVGVQDMKGEHFAVRREVETGSWLGLAHQGQGIGGEMRAAVLHLAFAGLGAQFAVTEAFTDNARSLAVSRRCGYEPDGITRHDRRGEVGVIQRLRLGRQRWQEHARVPVEIHGLSDGAKAMLAVT